MPRCKNRTLRSFWIFHRFLKLFLLAAVQNPVHSEGVYDDPSQVITKSFSAQTPEILEIRGQIRFTLKEGPRFEVVVKANRAVMDQVGVYTWFGFGTVAVESGLQGPREAGDAEATITIPNLKALRVLGSSHGYIVWPGNEPAKLTVSETSEADLVYSGPKLTLETDWRSVTTVHGSAVELDLTSRNLGKTDLTDVHIENLQLNLKESSFVKIGDVRTWSGTVRLGAQAVWDPTRPNDRKPQGTLQDTDR